MRRPKILDTSDELDSFDSEFNQEDYKPINLDFNRRQNEGYIYESIAEEIDLDSAMEDDRRENSEMVGYDE